jgi:hypothetical protein
MAYGQLNADTIIGSGASSVIINNGTSNVAGFTTGNNLQMLQNGGGIVFSNSSALTNSTLNDYETGTWTPNQGSGLTVTGTFASNGTYTKIGRIVIVNFTITATTLTCSGGAIISSNLPFATIADGIGYYGVGTVGTGTANNGFEAYVRNLYADTALTGTYQLYGTIVYNATF